MAKVKVTSKSPVTGREYILQDARNVEWFSHYGPDGSGYGYMTFNLHRPAGRDYPDIGYGYEVRVTKGPWRTVFHGQITKIAEKVDRGGVFTVWVLGFVHLMSSDTFNRVYCDTRLSAWVGDEEPSGNFRPDLFQWQVSEDAIIIEPRSNVEYTGTEYTSLAYAFQFGEGLARIKADYALSIPSDWAVLGGGLMLALVDSTGAVLWSSSTHGSGSVDIVLSSSPMWVELRLYFTGDGRHERGTNDVFGAFSGVKVYSVNVPRLDAAVIARDITAYMHRAGLGLSLSTALIQSTGLALEPSVFVDDRSPLDVLTWCCQFGNAAGVPVAFGVTFDETRRLFLEPYNLTDIRYVVKPNRGENVERTGDWSESAQKVYGVVRTEGAGVVRTSDLEAPSVINRLGGYYRRGSVGLDGIASAEQLSILMQLYLRERMHPETSGSYTVKGGVYTPEMRFVPVDEIVPGGLVQVQEWRSNEAGFSEDDYRDRKTTFTLAGVRVDLEAEEAELIPNEASDVFARQMAIIQQLRR